MSIDLRAESSLPPSDRSPQPDPEEITIDNRLRDRCDAFIKLKGLTQKAAARRIETSEAALSKWLALKPAGDVPLLENKVRAWLKRESERIDPTIKIFDSEIGHDLANRLNLISRTGALGVITSAVGSGKTCGIQAYWMTPENSSARVIDVFQWSRTAAGVRSGVWGQTPHDTWSPGKSTQDRWIIEHYRGSGVLFIFDRCENLSRSGLNWIVDFWETTRCPVALVADEEFVARLKNHRKLGHHFARVGYVEALKIRNPKKMAAQMLANMFPDQAEQLLELSEALLSQPGAGHALRNRLTMVKDTLKRGKIAAADEAFRLMHAVSPQAKLPLVPANKQLKEGK